MAVSTQQPVRNMLDVLKGKHTGISLFTCAYAEPKGFIGNTRDSMILQSHLFSDFGEAHGKNLLFFFFPPHIQFLWN